jgi:hypothetical protein
MAIVILHTKTNAISVQLLVQIILTPREVTPQNPLPFATALRDWNAAFVRTLVLGIANCLEGGVADANAVIQRFLEQVTTDKMKYCIC